MFAPELIPTRSPVCFERIKKLRRKIHNPVFDQHSYKIITATMINDETNLAYHVFIAIISTRNLNNSKTSCFKLFDHCKSFFA